MEILPFRDFPELSCIQTIEYTREPFEILGQGLLKVTPRSIENVRRDPWSLTLTQGHQEEWMN